MFLIKPVKGDKYIQKLFFSSKWATYSFLLFWSIFGEIQWKILFLVKKGTSQKLARKYLEILFFLISLKRGKSWGKFGFVWTTVLNQPEKETKSNKNCFPPKKMSHIQLNYPFLLFWSVFWEIHWKLFFLLKKWLSQKEAQKYLESLIFSTR